MFYTEKEIMSQHEALKKTYDYMISKKDQVKEFFEQNQQRKFTIFGCGSSYMLAKSGVRFFDACKDTSAAAIAGGDYLIHHDFYQETIKDSIVIVLSRSGQTTEIVRTIEDVKKKYHCPVISLTMKDDNMIMPYSDLDITMDWCYDKSVCQTRTVTNLYASMLLLSEFYSGDETGISEVKKAIDFNEDYKLKYRPLLQNIAKKPWEDAIVLADGPVIGIAEEGALAFAEICMLPGKCFNMLDYRHGPMVLNTEKTLTIVLISDKESKLQGDMIEDLKKHHGIIVTVSNEPEDKYGVDLHVCFGNIKDEKAIGIPFINVMQLISYEKAIELGGNPDEPKGLDAFITLK